MGINTYSLVCQSSTARSSLFGGVVRVVLDFPLALSSPLHVLLQALLQRLASVNRTDGFPVPPASSRHCRRQERSGLGVYPLWLPPQPELPA